MKKIFRKYLVLIIFVGLTIVGVFINFEEGDNSKIWHLWATVDVSLAVSLGVMALLAYWEFITSEDEVEIYFQAKEKKIDTGLSLLRKNCSRSEIMGILGMIRINDRENYTIAYFKDKKILKDLHRIQKGKDIEFIIPMSGDELEQFNLTLD